MEGEAKQFKLWILKKQLAGKEKYSKLYYYRSCQTYEEVI